MIQEGTEIVTVGRYGQKCANFNSGGCRFSIPIWTGKTYIAKRNYKGELKWFLKGCFGRSVASHRPSEKLVEEVKASGNYMPCITHLMKIKQTA